MDIIGMLQNGSGALAWLTAILLALGGTAVVVAVWTQVRRGVPVSTVLKAAVGIRQARPAPKPAAIEARPTPSQAAAGRPVPQQRVEPTHQAVRAYQAESTMASAGAATQAPPKIISDVQPVEAPAVLSERQLTVYLNRLRRAADTLEEIARRDAAAQGGTEDGTLLATH
jgi:hypothetical protein